MKNIIAVILCLVMIFSFAVPSFAVTADEQSTSLQSGWGSVTSAPSYPSGYSSSWFYRIAHNLFNIFDIQTDLKSGWSDTLTPTGFSGSFYAIVRNNLKTINSNLDYLEVDVESISSKLSDIMVDTGNIETSTSLYLNTINSSLISLLDIVPDIDSISSSAVSIKNSTSSSASSLSSIDSTFDSVYDFLSVSLDSYLSNQSLYLSSISDDISMLQQVHADEDDLALKEDSKPMEEVFTDTFFNSESDLSLNVDDLGLLTSYIREFKSSYNFRENIGNPTPLSVINNYSDFKNWFSSSTGQAMDPTFTPSGDGGLNSPGEIVTEAPTFDYDFANETVTAVGNGVVKLYLYGAEVSNPYQLQITGNEQWWSFKATAQEEGKLISPIAYYEVYRSATQPELDNLLTKAYEFPYLGDPDYILDGDGYWEGHFFTTNANPDSLTYSYVVNSSYNCTGFIEFDSSKPIYFKSDNNIADYYEVVFCDSSLTSFYLNVLDIVHVSDDIYQFSSLPEGSYSYFCFPRIRTSKPLTSDVIIYQEDTVSASTYSLRSSPSAQPDEFVPSFYEQRQNELLSILGVSK